MERMAPASRRARSTLTIAGVLAALGVFASLVLQPAAREQAADGLVRALHALTGSSRPGVDGIRAFLVEREEELRARAFDESRSGRERFAAAELYWQARALEVPALADGGFDRRFEVLFDAAAALPGEPGMLGLLLDALRARIEALGDPSLPGPGAHDDVHWLAHEIARVGAEQETDNGLWPLFAAELRLREGAVLESRDLLRRAARLQEIDPHLRARMSAAEAGLVDLGIDPLDAREFLVRDAFERPSSRPGQSFLAFARELARADRAAPTEVVAEDHEDVGRAAALIAASTLRKDDALDARAALAAYRAEIRDRVPPELVLATGPDPGDEQDGRRSAWSANRAIENSATYAAIAAVHGNLAALAFVSLVLALVAAVLGRGRARPATRVALSPGGFLIAVAAPFLLAAALASENTWPFAPGRDVLGVLAQPHPALLLLPLLVLPMVLLPVLVRSELRSRAAFFRIVSRVLGVSAFALMLVFAVTVPAAASLRVRRDRAIDQSLVQPSAPDDVAGSDTHGE